jgi:hypothetical protein
MSPAPAWGSERDWDKSEAHGGGAVVVPQSDATIVGEKLAAEKSINANFISRIPHVGRPLGSTVKLVEGVGVGEGLEAGACRWQLTAVRCAEEQKGTLASSRGSTWG